MITRKTKIGVISAGIFATTAVTTVTAINMARADENDKIFVQLDGQTFTSRSKLTEYVKSMADMQTFNTGETAFSINVGQNSLMFTNATQASRYVEEYFTTNFTAYLKPNHEKYIDPLTGIISSEGYYKASDIFFNTYKTNNGGYTFALKGDIEANEKAEREASESYITMHNAYRWNGIYFNNEVSLERYLRTEIDSVDRVDQESLPGFVNEAGVGRVFDFDDEADVESFERWSANSSYPNIEFDNGQLERLTPDNIGNIASLTDDEIYSYIPINSNNDEVTKIIDISSNTETGSLYGPYTTTSGSNTSSIHNSENWKKTNEEIEGFSGYDSEIEKISNLINIMFMEYSNSNDVLEDFVTEYKPYGVNLFDIIKPIEVQTKKFINDISMGQRGALFNSVHSLYSYVINQLIQEEQPKEMFDEFIGYMNEIADYMDGKAAASLLPFLNGLEGDEIEINFFKEIYSFGEKGFQDNINSYWRAIDDDDEYGLSTIRDLLVMVADIANLATANIKVNDEIIENHVKIYGLQNGEDLIGVWDREYADELAKIQDRNLTKEIGIQNLSHIDIYHNIDFIVEHIYVEAIDKYFFDLETSLIEDPNMLFYENSETSREFYLGLEIINNEEWQEVGNTYQSEKDLWDDRKAVGSILADTITLLFETKIYSKEYWYESIMTGNVGELAGVYFQVLDIGVAIAVLLLGVASGGVLTIAYGIYKAVVNGLISLLPEATFAGSRQHVYSFFDTDTADKWYWDGGLESWTWWGIGGTDSIGLESLKMIVTDNIIDGYSQDGYYYNGEIYDSPERAKIEELTDLMHEINNEVYIQNRYNIERDNVVWETRFQGQGSIEHATLEETHEFLMDENNWQDYSEDFYNVDGMLTDDDNKIIEAEIEKWLSTIKPIIIIQNPKLLTDGNYLKSEFDLPKPRYTDDGFEAFEGSNPDYEVMDVNINMDILNEGVVDGSYTQDFVDLMYSIVNMTEGERIDALFSTYASFLTPQSKVVLFDEMNDQGSNMVFDELSSNIESAKLVEVKFQDGSIHTFINKISAIDNLLSSENYEYNVVDIARDYKQYMFKEYAAPTIDALIEDIIKQSKGGIYA